MFTIKQFVRAHGLVGAKELGGTQHYYGPAPCQADALRLPQGFTELRACRDNTGSRAWASARELAIIVANDGNLLVTVHHDRASYEQDIGRQQRLYQARRRAHGAPSPAPHPNVAVPLL